MKNSQFQESPHRQWNPDVWYPVLLVAAGILFFSDPLFSSKNFFFRDILNFHHPLHKILIGSYARGEFPLWNPYVYLGQPMLGNPNYMAFYPTNVFHLFLPFDYAFKLHFIIHPILGGMGAYFLLRRLGIVQMAAFGGSLVYQFSGTVLSFLNLYSIVQTVALLPWMGWAFLGALRGSWWRNSLLFGAILALQIITFEPLLLQCAVFLLAGIALLYALDSREPVVALRRILRVGSVGGVYGLTLAAVQVIPTLELLSHSARAGGLDPEKISDWSMHPLEFIGIIIPNLFGDPFSFNRDSYWGEQFHSGREPYLVSYFIGANAVLLCTISAFSFRRKMWMVFLGIGIVGVSLALGEFSPIYRWLYEHIPALSVGRYPSKYFLLSALALAMLSALGLEFLIRCEETGGQGRRRLVVAALMGIVISGVLLGGWAWMRTNPAPMSDFILGHIDTEIVAYKQIGSIVSELLVSARTTGAFLLVSIVLVLALGYWKGTKIFSRLIILAAVFELTSVNLGLLPLVSGADVEFVPEVNLYLQSRTGHRIERIFHLDPPWGMPVRWLWSPTRSSAWSTYYYRMTGQPMYGINHGIQYALYESVDLLTTLESQELWRKYSHISGEGTFRLFQKLNVGVLLTVKEVQDERVELLKSFNTFSDRRINVYRVEGSLPRVYFVSGVERARSPEDALERFVNPDFPFRSTAILENPRYVERPAEGAEGSANVVEYGNNRVVCEVDASVDGFLVLLDTYYPGWKAYVDGRESEILRANYAFRAVEVPSGRHRIEFRYSPLSFYTGLGITLISVLVGAMTMVFSSVANRTRHRSGSSI